MSLKLSVHLMPDNEGVVVFNCSGQKLRINRLNRVLQFVANLKHLSMAIDLAGKVDSCYELSDYLGLQWILNCTFKKGVVGLELWFQDHGFSDHLDTVFNWRGTADDFRNAVNFMIDKMGSYQFFKKPIYGQV